VIRPSSLDIAELCGLAPALAEKYPEENDYSQEGKAFHAEIAGGDAPEISDEAAAAIAWVRENLTGELRFEQHVKLFDPETMQVITEGTPDLVAGPGEYGGMSVVDWKKKGQFFAGYLQSPDEKLQTIAYGLAICEGRPFRVAIVLLDGKKAEALWSRVFQHDEHPALLARVRAAANREPVPHLGHQCSRCYQRQYCHAWLAQMQTALAPLAAKDQDPGNLVLNAELATELSTRIDFAEDWLKAAKAARNDFVRSGGVCRVGDKVLTLPIRSGKNTADDKALEAAGLGQYIKQGEPYEFPTWKKVKE
jgi:hypothetical protein